MTVVAPVLVCFALYLLGYRFYAQFLAQRLFALDPKRDTPAHTHKDGVDYLPTRRSIVFGHHFASITGLAPMLGPAVAVIWGWLPAMAWVVLGAILVGCVHDMSALVLSLRARGLSMGAVAEGILGRRAKRLFHAIIFFGIALAMGVFVFVIASLFTVQMAPGQPGFPGAVTPSGGLMVIALILGHLLYRRGWRLGPLATVAFMLSLVLVVLGYHFPTMGLDAAMWPERSTWIWVLLAYAFAASVLPVWVLLQARDFVNSMLLYLGLVACYLGIFIAAPTFQAPAVRLQVEGAPSILPFVFIIIACGAASGFHGLVSSGTTAKQLNRETDAPAVGYGGMVAESLLGLLAVLATTAGFASKEAWFAHYHDWNSAQGLATKVGGFINGAGMFITALGVEQKLAAAFIAVVVVSFALTTLDSATRLLRYNIEEIADTFDLKLNRYLSSAGAVLVIMVFAFYKVGGKPAALALWTLFGSTNQLLAGLTLLTVTLYLRQRGKPIWFTGIPAVFILTSTLIAMTQNLISFARGGQTLLLVVGGCLWVVALWILVEGAREVRRNRRVGTLEVELAS